MTLHPLETERAAHTIYQTETDTEFQAGAEHTARLAELYEQPALGAWRAGRQPPPFPADAPPLPPPSFHQWTRAQLVDEARYIAADIAAGRDLGGVEVAVEVIVALGQRSNLPDAAIATALKELTS